MLNEILDMHWAWVIGGLVLIGLELLIPGVYMIWIGVGAVAAGLMLAAFPDMALSWQLIVFSVAMLASISSGFLIQNRSRKSTDMLFLNKSLSAMVGKRYVASTVFVAGRGRITVGDTSYAAIGEDETKPGDVVEVTGLQDDTPVVKKV